MDGITKFRNLHKRLIAKQPAETLTDLFQQAGTLIERMTSLDLSVPLSVAEAARELRETLRAIVNSESPEERAEAQRLRAEMKEEELNKVAAELMSALTTREEEEEVKETH